MARASVEVVARAEVERRNEAGAAFGARAEVKTAAFVAVAGYSLVGTMAGVIAAGGASGPDFAGLQMSIAVVRPLQTDGNVQEVESTAYAGSPVSGAGQGVSVFGSSVDGGG